MTKIDIYFLSALSVLSIALFLAGIIIHPGFIYALLVILSLAIIAVVIRMIRSLQQHLDRKIAELGSQQSRLISITQDLPSTIQPKLDELCSQVDSLFGLYNYLDNIRKPLPVMNKWTVSPDFASIIISLILGKKPGFILEAGSGISTLIIGYCLEKAGTGKLISLEHDQVYAEKTKELIIQHGLGNYAQVVYSPVKEYSIDNNKWLWYDLDRLNLRSKIDFLLVDGPPGELQTYARYPALPLLYDFISDDGVILLDDGNRHDEKKTVEKWAETYPSLKIEYIESERGAYRIRINRR